MKIYVAGPMTGVEGFNYPVFHAAATELEVRGYEVLNPADTELLNPTPGLPQTWDWYMRHALRMVVDSDGICLLPGWQASKGANLEVEVGYSLQLDIRPLDDWLKSGVRA